MGEINEEDSDVEVDFCKNPQIRYFSKCDQNMDLCLPLFKHVIGKTLCLRNYTLSAGQCEGIAAAFQNVDNHLLNRVFFDNCGLDDYEFSQILNSVAQWRDSKSITLKNNEFGSLSLVELKKLFLNKVPFQLQHL